MAYRAAFNSKKISVRVLGYNVNYRDFQWQKVDQKTIQALSSAVGYAGNQQAEALQYLEQHANKPDRNFIKIHRETIQDWLFDSSRGGRYLDVVARCLIDRGLGGLNYLPEKREAIIKYVKHVRNTVNFQSVLLEALLDQGSGNPDENRLLEAIGRPSFSLFPSRSKQAPVPARDYQTKAWEILGENLAKSKSTGKFCGLLVMPTGAGKTFTAVRWLLENVIEKGRKVLWLAHRHFLIEQAAGSFQKNCSILRTKISVKVRLISGIHSPADTVLSGEDDIVLAMPHLLRDPERVRFLLKASDDYFIVIDEAHHAAAGSYQEFIRELKKRKEYSLLGLTATPTRTSDDEKPVLAQLFDYNIIAPTDLHRLCELGHLAWPHLERGDTDYTVDKNLTKDDEEMMRKNDLGPDMTESLIHDEGRNQVIVQRYLQFRDRYRKTLVFAVNVLHAHLLKDAFNDAFKTNGLNVRSEYTTSYRIETEGAENPDDNETIRDFREAGSGLDVLINVERLTEGLDIPEINTVFLARPTHSEILCRQMIGRGLRPKSTGENIAYLVAFRDHWERFKDWADPFKLVPDVEALDRARKEPEEKIEKAAELGAEVPWAVITEFARFWRQRIHTAEIAFDQVIEGWYTLDLSDLESDEEPESTSTIIPVYSHQKYWWELLFKKARAADFAGNLRELAVECFADCDVPAPSMTQIVNLVSHLQNKKSIPDYHAYEARSQSDPKKIAEAIKTADMRQSEKTEHLKKIYELPLTRSVYRSFSEFEQAVDAGLRHEESVRMPYAEIYEDFGAKHQITPASRDLQEIFETKVKPLAEKILNVQPLPFKAEMTFTHHNLKSYWGLAIQTDEIGDGSIRINRILNSIEIGEEILEFVLWHEYLHLFLNKEGHTDTFRKYEKQWPEFNIIMGKLHTINEKYLVSYF